MEAKSSVSTTSKRAQQQEVICFSRFFINNQQTHMSVIGISLNKSYAFQKDILFDIFKGLLAVHYDFLSQLKCRLTAPAAG